MVREGRFIAMVGTFLIGCAVLLVVGCAGVRSGAPQGEQEHTEATNEQGRSPEATASEEARCGETRTFKGIGGELFTTNDQPGCPHGGLLLGTDKPDKLTGQEGDDKIRSLSGRDLISGGAGNDVIYGGPGDDVMLNGDEGDDVVYGGDGDDEELYGDGDLDQGEDVIYGGDGNDTIYASGDGQRDRLYCGEGIDHYAADKVDFVSSSCEKKTGVLVS